MNNVTKSILGTVALMNVAFLSVAQAADGQITFTGKVTAASCDVSTGSKDFSVALPNISAAAIGSSLGDMAGQTSFSITLENCVSQTENAEKVRVAFVGVADDNNIYALKNTVTSNGATGVGLQLLQRDGSSKIDINNGNNKDKLYAIPAKGEAPASLELQYNVAYINTLGTAPTTGDVQAIATYSVEYN